MQVRMEHLRMSARFASPTDKTTCIRSRSIASVLLVLASVPLTAQVHVRLINAKTNQPIPDEKLNVALREDQIGSVAMPADKNGIVTVDTGKATIIRILSNMYADCRPRGELYLNYPVADIQKHGITTGNLCSTLQQPAKPGELILYEIPKTFVPSMPAGPNPTTSH
jgi:hypothetical protein